MNKEKEFVQNFALELTNRTLEEREEIGRKYYQQLQAKEQECERLKKEIGLYDCIEKWGTKECHCACRCLGNEFCDDADKKINQLKAEVYLLQQYKKSKQASYESMQVEWNKAVSQNQDLLKQNEEWQKKYDQLKAENEKLKEENAKARMEICNQCSERDDYNIPCKQIRDLDYGLQLELEENEKLKQALQKIKEIAQYDIYTPHTDLCIKLSWVKKKISEVIKDEE